jgi:eukaryotic-like serine/threonine-protein kinase
MSATTPAAKSVQRIGRFELVHRLGRGAQATVWRAHDPRLQRDVALKCLESVTGGAALGEWLREARAVSRLSHPHVVPVFEADEQDGVAYLVFELVEGATLAQRQSPRAPMDARQAVQLMLGVLEALEFAHRSGIVHRDLKPSNILVDADGRARVMDFGIAARLNDGADGLIVGTPGYMSPEAARGEAPVALMDVFAAGAVLGELLCGQGMLWSGGVADWVRRVQTEDLRLPPQGAGDAKLRAIVQRALARDPAQRYPSAQALRAALQDWMQPADSRPAPAAADAVVSTHGTLEFLLRRMRHRSDFPALSASVLRIQRLASSDSESLGSLCAEILKDVALTNKLLRMVNTAHYGPDGGGGIGTISRAVSLVGFAGIRNMALSLLLLEQMRDRDHAELLTLEFLRALMAGTLASELAGPQHDREHVFLGAMFQGLGRLLTEYYLPEEAQQIRHLLPPASSGIESWRRREAVATQVLGLGFEELGIGVARSWGLPEALLRCMRRPEGDAPARAADGVLRQRWLGSCAHTMTDAMLGCDGEAATPHLHAAAERHARVLDSPVPAMLAAVAVARERVAALVAALNLQVASHSPAHRLLASADRAADDTNAADPLQATVIMATMTPAVGHAASTPTAADQLAAGMQDITQAMLAADIDLNAVLRMVLETMYRALGFQRVIFCLRESRADMLGGRFGLGAGGHEVVRHVRIPLSADAAATDLFAAVCHKGVDSLIKDTKQAGIAARLPGWYRRHLDAGAFMLLPMVLKGATFALIYADMARAGDIRIDERELSLLRSLRNQAVMAFRQAG